MRTPELQILAMIEALRLYSPDLEVASKRHIDRPNEEPAISITLTDDPQQVAKTLRWLRRENTRLEANIWVRPIPSEEHPWLFLDDLSRETAFRLAKKYASLLVETTKDNFQCRLLADRPLDFVQRGVAQARLVSLLNQRVHNEAADPGSIAGDKWGRLAGFKNRKPGRDCWTNLVLDTTTTSPRLDPSPYLSPNQGGGCASLPVSNKSFRKPGVSSASESEREFGWVVGRLRLFQQKGYDLNAESLRLKEALEIQARARGKKNFQDYARRTIEAALRAIAK